LLTTSTSASAYTSLPDRGPLHPPPIPSRSYYNVSRFNERFERAYVLQSREEVRWQRRQKELLDGWVHEVVGQAPRLRDPAAPRCSERKLMAARPDWVIGKRRFFLQWEDKPDIDCLEPRKIGPFF
jgi:hypothetical protein